MRFVAAALTICMSLTVWADDISLLAARSQSHAARLELIRKETKELRLNTYIFELDVFGKEQIGLLVDAAKRGVKVKLSVDGWMAGLPKHYAILQALEDAGIEVKIYNPVYRNSASFNYRNHMKGLFGSDHMILGGRNMKHHYFERRSPKNFIDVDVLVKGEQVELGKKNYDLVFNSSQMKKPTGFSLMDKYLIQAKKDLIEWSNDAIKKPMKDVYLSVTSKYIKVEDVKYHADAPDGYFTKHSDSLHKKVLGMINRSEKSLDFTNPYVLLTPETKEALQKAIDRGVKVRINSNSALTQDSHVMGMAWDAKKYEMIDMGIEVNELRKGYYIHAKTIVRDGEEIFVGSFNLDPRSQNLNLENGIFIKDETLAKNLSSHNRRIVSGFMNKVEKLDLKKMAIGDRVNHCVKSAFGKLITKALYPVL